MGIMCQISEINGQKETNCGDSRNENKKILRVESMPLRVSNEPNMKPSLYERGIE